MKIKRNEFSRQNVDGVDVLLTDSPKVKNEIKKRTAIKKAIWGSVLGALLFVFVLNIVILPLTGDCARVGDVATYDGDNQYITFHKNSGLMLSAHRAGGDLAPEETLSAFKLCMESTAYKVDIVEFDLHLTKDGHLVLMHDHEVDRTSNGVQVFGEEGVKVCDKTLAELKTLNFGYNFKDLQGNYPYRNLSENEIPDDVRILTLEEVLTYLQNARPDKDLYYIIEIKDKGDIGRQSMDKLFEAMQRYDILDRTIVGTFNGDITKYIDKQYGGQVVRSAGILEVLNFYYAFLWGRKLDASKLGYRVLQIPVGLTEKYFSLSSKAFIDYAHAHGIAVQYWTINDEEQALMLRENGADAIMTDNPEKIYNKIQNGLII